MKKIIALSAAFLFCACDVPWKVYDQADVCICEHTFKDHPKGEGVCLVEGCTCDGFFFMENGEDDENVRDTSETSQSRYGTSLHPRNGNLNREVVQPSIRHPHE